MPDPAESFVDEIGFALKGIYGDAATDASGGGLSFDYLDANAAKYAKERGAELIGTNENAWSVDQTTRDEVNRLLQEAMDEGISPQEFASRLEESGLFGEARAEVIARTEVAIAQNYGQSETYAALGFDRVYVQDGDCDICREVDGKVASIAWIQANPVGHPNAVFSGTPVMTVGGVAAAYRAEWSGPARSIRTAMGNHLTVSPNHPVLTGRGWVAAKDVREGDDVVRGCWEDLVVGPPDLDLHQRPALVEDVFDALALDAAPSRCPAAPTHLHGDGNFCKGDIEVVRAERLLTGEWDAPFVQKPHELVLSEARVQLEPLSGDRPRELGGDGVPLAAACSVGGGDVGRVGVAAPEFDAEPTEAVSEAAVADADFLREFQGRFALPVSLDKVVEARDLDALATHAFDLTTGHCTYFASGLLVHNCVRSCSPAPEDEPIELD